MAVLVGWKMKKMGGIRQRKTLDLSIFNVQVQVEKMVDQDLPSDSRLHTHHEDYESSSPASSDATAVEPPYTSKDSNKEALVNFHWSQVHLDQDNFNTFNNLGTDFTGDFAVVTNVRLNAQGHAPEGVSICVFGYKKSHKWSPAITVNTMVQINVKSNELVQVDGEQLKCNNYAIMINIDLPRNRL